MATPYSEDVRQVVKFKVRQDGGHVKVRVFAGQENSPGLCGELTMRREEWLLLRRHLDADAVGGSRCQIHYEGGVEVWLAEIRAKAAEAPVGAPADAAAWMARRWARGAGDDDYRGGGA